MDNHINQSLYADSIKEATKVEFLASREELFLYAVSLHNSMMWGRKIDRENLRSKKRVKKLGRTSRV